MCPDILLNLNSAFVNVPEASELLELVEDLRQISLGDEGIADGTWFDPSQ